jgi:hypothetical protein
MEGQMSEFNNDKSDNVKNGEAVANHDGHGRNHQQGRGNNGRHHHNGPRNYERRNRYNNSNEKSNGENRKAPKENIAQREVGKNIADVPVKKSIQAQNNTADARDVHTQRNPKHQKFGVARDSQRNREFVKVEETREDIIRDIGRIEKEIELEIKEISALKFGM